MKGIKNKKIKRNCLTHLQLRVHDVLVNFLNFKEQNPTDPTASRC
jgi:hypothetical protein